MRHREWEAILADLDLVIPSIKVGSLSSLWKVVFINQRGHCVVQAHIKSM